jgi:hypothetical protein
VAQLNWDLPGERFYEAGVDRGVLYLNDIGYAWPGLVSVAESSSGGTPKPYYIDGYKYANVASAEEFQATITAFSSPSEFSVCDGVGVVHTGLFATQQPRRSFNFSYRTRIGNDIEATEYGYKIHLVYNALAAPANQTHNTIGDNATPSTLSWAITTLAPKISNLRPTSHFVVDSRSTPEVVLNELEDILYGTDALTATIPTVSELIDLFDVAA